jgi:hypothetical protein
MSSGAFTVLTGAFEVRRTQDRGKGVNRADGKLLCDKSVAGRSWV